MLSLTFCFVYFKDEDAADYTWERYAFPFEENINQLQMAKCKAEQLMDQLKAKRPDGDVICRRIWLDDTIIGIWRPKNMGEHSDFD